MNDKECIIIDFFSNMENNIRDIEPLIDNESLTELKSLIDNENDIIFLNQYIIDNNDLFDYYDIFEKLIENHIKGYSWLNNESVKVL